MYPKLVTAVRLLFGLQLTINGFNWFVKIITPYPSISDFFPGPSPFPPGDIVSALVHLGLFHVVKLTELLAGISLLTDLYVPLMLVLVFPTLLSTLVVDALHFEHIRGVLMGGGAFINAGFLMLAYFSRYKPMLAARNQPDPL